MFTLAAWQQSMELLTAHPWWVGFGLLGEAVFMSRFVVQWVASERAGRSHVPLVFWYLSMVGTIVLAVYAVWRRDPVFILGQSLPCVIYVRNLVLIYRERSARPVG